MNGVKIKESDLEWWKENRSKITVMDVFPNEKQVSHRIASV